MGGTTAKAGVIYRGEALTTGAALLGGYDKALPVQIAMMDIFEVSAGGGSIARVDEDGALHVVPRAPGLFPAFGMLFSDLRYDFVRTWLTALEAASFDEIEAVHCELEESGRAAIAAASVSPGEVAVERAADMRYVGQEHAVTVDLTMEVFENRDREAIKALFDAMHELRYGANAPAEKAGIVSLRTTVTGVMRKPAHEIVAAGGAEPPEGARSGERPVYFDAAGGFRHARLHARRAAGRQPHRRTGADRGAGLDHRRHAGRCVGGRWVRPHAPSRPGGDRAGAQRRYRGDRGDEDQPHAHRLQRDHLRGA